MTDVAERRFGGGWDWPDWSQQDLVRRGRLQSVIWPALFMFYLVEPVTSAFGGHRSAAFRFGVLALVLVFAAVYLLVNWYSPRSSPLARTLLIGSLALFPVALALLQGPEQLIYFTYFVSPALIFLPRNVGALLGVACAASLLIATRVIDGSANWNLALVLVVLTMAMFGFSALIRTVRLLRAAQDKMARLAVAEERSRLARDLHDVLGHSLTTITVKAGLARRVLESSADRERAIAEVRDVEELARQALTDVRATVSGYRTASLPAELVGARAALQAAGIAADLPRAVDNVAAGLQETFAYVLREGVTNVIRHSGASRCAVRLGDNWLEIRDNGRASADGVMIARSNGGGHGLGGLAERLAQVDGQLEATPLPEGGFLLRVSARTPKRPKDERDDALPATNVVARPSVGLT